VLDLQGHERPTTEPQKAHRDPGDPRQDRTCPATATPPFGVAKVLN
jgi:hypothetical protein